MDEELKVFLKSLDGGELVGSWRMVIMREG